VPLIQIQADNADRRRHKTFVERNRIDRAVEFSEVGRFCNASPRPFQKSIWGF
jgi:hypothetical protein